MQWLYEGIGRRCFEEVMEAQRRQRVPERLDGRRPGITGDQVGMGCVRASEL